MLTSVLAMALGTVQLLICEPSTSVEATAAKTRSVGALGSKVSTGVYLVNLRNDLTAEQAKKMLLKNGIDAVFPTSAQNYAPGSLPSLEQHIEYRRAASKAGGGSGRAPGFLEAQRYYLKLRVNELGLLSPETYAKAAKAHRNMPGAPSDWFGSSPGEGASGTWSWIGPKRCDTPYSRFFGPGSVSGRKNDLAYAPSNSSVIYAATAAGGVWKTTDSGSNWSCKSDNWDFLHTSCVAVHPEDPNTVWVGTGDKEGKFTAQVQGVMKSTDGGATWSQKGASEFFDQIVTEILVFPSSPNRLIACTKHAYLGTGGIYYSADGGDTWHLTASGNWEDMDRSGVANPNTNVYRVWAVSGSSIAYSDDRGETWTFANRPSFFSSNESGIDVAASLVDYDGVYVIGASSERVAKSMNGGSSWSNVTNDLPRDATFPSGTTTNYNFSQKNYDLYIETVKNGNSETIIVGLITIAASSDGGANWVNIGKTWQDPALTHNDQHCFEPHPTLDNAGLAGNDGGVFFMAYTPFFPYTTVFNSLNDDLGDHLAVGVSVHPTSGNYVICGLQDGASPASRGNLNDWDCLEAGDGGHSLFMNSSVHYTSSNFGSVHRYETSTSMSPFTSGPANGPYVVGLLERGGTNRDILFTATSGTVSFHAAVPLNGLWLPSTTTLGNVTCIHVSPSDPTRVYAGTDTGHLWVSNNSGGSFTEKGLNWTGVVGAISENPNDPADVIVGLQHTLSSERIVRSRNFTSASRTWTDIGGSGANALPQMPINDVVRDPYEPTIIYAASDFGVYISQDAGATWFSTSSRGLPNVIVTDLCINDTETYLYAATFGRGVWRIPLKSVQVSSLTLSDLSVIAGSKSTATVRLSNVAPPGTIVSLSDNSSALTTPSTVSIPAGGLSGSVQLTGGFASVNTPVTITATYKSSSKTANLTVYATPVIEDILFDPNPVVSTSTCSGTVRLVNPAPIQTTLVLSDTSSIVSLSPTTVNIAAGSRSAGFTASISAAYAAAQATVSAKIKNYSASSISRTLNIDPIPAISSVAVLPVVVNGGSPFTVNVILSGQPPSSGADVALSDNSSAAGGLGTLHIHAPSTVGQMQGTTTQVSRSVIVTVTARYATSTRTTTFTVLP